MTDIQPGFIVTKEYRRFVEFCDACRRYRYIGLCHGPPGVGKTLSARRYARWDLLEPYLVRAAHGDAGPAEVVECRTLLYTPEVANTPRGVATDLRHLMLDFRWVREDAGASKQLYPTDAELAANVELLIVDEADRLKMQGLEQVRDTYDRSHFGLILIGMPGIEKRLARYPQLYSRVGFVHAYRPLSTEEIAFVLAHHWDQLELKFSPTDFTDAEAMAAVVRITGGNFRLIHRLFTQVERILQLNELHTVSREVVEAAREGLVIGPV